MAIYGVGSNLSDSEKKDKFFKDNNFVIGWNYDNAKDLYDMVSLLKAGDIVYLKANAAGSKKITVKGIGIITQSFIHTFIETKLIPKDIIKWESLKVKVKWIIKDEFIITIPNNDGKLTNVRAATFYEECLPYVQREIINHLFKDIPDQTD